MGAATPVEKLERDLPIVTDRTAEVQFKTSL